MMKRLLLLLPLVFGAVASCSESPTSPSAIASVTILFHDLPAPDSLALTVGQSVQFTATLSNAKGEPITDRTVTWMSTNAGVASVTPDGVVTANTPGSTKVIASAEGRADTVTIGVTAPSALECEAGATALVLGVGEVFTTTAMANQTLCIGGGDTGAEYTYVPFNASSVAASNLAVEVVGGRVIPVIGPPNPSVAPSFSMAPGVLPAAPASGDGGFEARLRARERALDALVPGARAAYEARRTGPSYAVAAALPAPGDLMTLNANANVGCTSPDLRTGRVVAVSTRAIVVSDTTNPAGGFTPEEFQSVAAAFDTLVYPVDTQNFGEPTDIDQNGRVIIFYTRAVNELTPRGANFVVGGFFYSRDLFPKTAQPGFEACPASNYAEMFYMLAPDPTGVVNGNVRTKDFVFTSTIATVAHEFQHLISAARRLYVLKVQNYREEAWLNEGLSHIAEELLFYRVSGLTPRMNLDRNTVLSGTPRQAFLNYQQQNIGRYITYLKAPEQNTLIGVNDELETRGSAWAFLRYTADRRGGVDRDLWFNLVNSPLTGVANLRAALGTDPIQWMQDWTASVYADDAVQTPAIYQQPSWNFRSVVPAFSGTFPLKTFNLAPAEALNLTLKGGGAAFVRFGVAPLTQTALRTTSGGTVAPERLRITLIRTR